jgi:hypothetical protein
MRRLRVDRVERARVKGARNILAIHPTGTAYALLAIGYPKVHFC